VSGPRGRAALAHEYAAADLVVVPTRTESFGIVAVEALAHGVPVVASDVGGVPEAVGTAPSGCVPGVLVPPGDAAALAGALHTWLTQPDVRATWRSASEVRRLAVGSWQQTAARVEEILAPQPAEVTS
jgi:glycosyltransferase involved in cell wall biosynthesis